MVQLTTPQDMEDVLTRYGKIQKDISILEEEKDDIRSAIYKEMQDRGIEKHEVRDKDNELWQLSILSQTRKTIDKGYLDKVLNQEQLENAYKTSTNEQFKIQKITKRTRK